MKKDRWSLSIGLLHLWDTILAQASLALASSVSWVKAVSYTHLDVYKRQVQLSPGVFVGGEQGRPHPVSYTHLDVYKRQR